MSNSYDETRICANCGDNFFNGYVILRTDNRFNQCGCVGPLYFCCAECLAEYLDVPFYNEDELNEEELDEEDE